MSSNVAIGSVVIWPGPGTSIPNGWLICDGTSYEQAQYPELYAAIGTIYGGSGSQFNVPDYRGIFLRGVDGGANRDSDSSNRVPAPGAGSTSLSVGSTQDDNVQAHAHNLPQTTFAASGTIMADNQAQYGSSIGLWSNPGTLAPNPTFQAGGSETRPVNIYVYFIIKYA